MAKDAHWGAVTLAMHMDGADGYTVFLDLKGNVATPVGNAKISTAQSKFGVSSLYLDGTGDLLTIPNSASLYVGASDFTLEMWVRRDAGSSGRLYSHGEVGGHIWPIFELDVGAAGATLRLGYQNANTTTNFTATVSIPDGVWTHLAATRYGNQIYLFVNGVLGASGLWANTVYNSGTQVCVGGYYNYESPYACFKGHIDDLRLTKGVARYTANFTPPTEPFPNGPVEVGGTILDSNGSPIARTVRVYDRLTGALVGSGASNASSGTYSIGISTANEVQVVMLDDDLGTLENDQIIRTIPV